MLQLLQQALAKYLNVEQQAHWLLIKKGINQLRHVMMSLCQTELDLSDCDIEFCDRTLDLSSPLFINIWHPVLPWID